MKTLTILKLEAGQKIPRPMGQASSQNELAEMVAYTVIYTSSMAKHNSPGRAMREAKAEADIANGWLGTIIKVQNIDTETPVAEVGTTKFYAFSNE